MVLRQFRLSTQRAVLRGQLVVGGVDFVELPQAALDLAAEVGVDHRTGHALGDEANELVDRLELVGEALDAAEALLAMLHAAGDDVAAALGAIEREHVLREVVAAGEAEGFEAALVGDGEPDEVIEEVLELEAGGFAGIGALDLLDELAQLDVLLLADRTGRAELAEADGLAAAALADLGLAVEVTAHTAIARRRDTEADDREHRDERAEQPGVAKADARGEDGERDADGTADRATHVREARVTNRERGGRGGDEAGLRGEGLHEVGSCDLRAIGGAFRAGALFLGRWSPTPHRGERGARRRTLGAVASASSEEPILRWTPEEVWVMAGLAQRLLVATIDGVEHASTEGGVFHAEVHAGAESIEVALAFDADAARLALGARDPAGQRWRDGWLLEIARGDERWILEPGGSTEIGDARRGPIVAHLRVRRRALIAARAEDHVPLVDVAFHRYTRQSTIATERTFADGVVPWMTPTAEEPAPWWEIDLGQPRCITWMRIDLAPLPSGTRITCHAFGHPTPTGTTPAGSVVSEITGDALHVVDGQAWFTVVDAVVARYVRVQAHAADGATVTLEIVAAEIQAAELYAETLAQTLRRAFVLHADRTLCLIRSVDGYDPSIRYGDMWERAKALSRGLAARLEPCEERIVVGVMTRNRPEWIATDLAIVERGYVSVALAPDDSDDRLAQIFALAKPTCVVVEAPDAARVARLATTAKLVVVLDGPAAGDNQVAFDALVADEEPPPRAPRAEDDLYAVLFTSGSTGMPKGAMRTYRTFNAMIASYAIGHSPRHLSFQPLSHLSERMYLPAILVNGGTIAFSQGGAHLIDELRALGPTTVGSVPRLWEVLYAGYARRVRADPDDEPRILAETRAQLGDRLLAVSVGSAPCSAEVLAFLRRCFADVWVTEGYGTTELGTIAVDGVIAKDVAVKLVPLADGAATDGGDRGEIWVKSPHVIAGYLGEATTTVDAEGFVATGDLGERDASGRVRIIGRVRNTIKLAQGEFVSVDRVEAILASSPVVDRIFVHAGYGSSHLAAVVVPRADVAREVDIAAALRAHAGAAGLAPYEVPAEVLLECEPFSVENGLLTASGKLARGALVAKYGARLGPATRPTIADLSRADDSLAERIARIASQVAKRAISIDEPLGAGIGVDSLAAAEILAAISEELERDVPLAWWFEARTIGDLAARLVAAPAATDVAANRELARADLALATPTPISTSPPPVRRVLLTGATGFLGAFLVEALHAHGIAVTCLVRARDDAEAQRRLDAVLAEREIDAPATAIAGDLAALAIDIDVDAIVHAGATVSWLASYEALRAPNVLGTLALLELAARRGVPFHHVSTISTAPADGDETSLLAFETALVSTPYALSKWIAEAHVRRAGEAGLPVAVYRPAMIAADTRRGIGNADDYLNRYLVGCAELGLYIDREDAVIDMTPVDFVARAIATCVARGRTGETLHLANVEQSMTYAALGRALVAAGLCAAPATYEAFRAALLANRTSRLHPLAAFFPARFSLGMGPWPCARSVETLAAQGIQRPRIDDALIARYVARLRKQERL